VRDGESLGGPYEGRVSKVRRGKDLMRKKKLLSGRRTASGIGGHQRWALSGRTGFVNC